MSTITEFRSQFLGGARPTLYQVSLTFPAGVADASASEKFKFSAKGAQIPGVSTGIIEVPFQGRTLKLAGDRQFQPISFQVLNDNDWLLRNAFERWMSLMNGHESNVGAVRPQEYQVDMVIEQLDRSGKVVASYTLIGAFPSDVSPIELGYDQVDTVSEFSLTLEYQWWVRPSENIL